MEAYYKLSLTLGRLSLVLESHDRDWVERKQVELMGTLLENPQALLDVARIDEHEKKQKQIAPADESHTIQEFFRKYVGANRSRPETALFLIYYLEKIKKQQVISSADVRSAFKDIAYPSYGKINFTDVLNQSKAKGLLNKDGNNWKLTISGVDFILSSINSDSK